MRSGLILTGTRGAGKTTLARALKDLQVAATVPAVTTRPPRPDDAAGAYEHVTAHELEAEGRDGALLVRSAYGPDGYGIRRSAVHSLLDVGSVPLLTITPESALRLATEDTTVRWRAVFLDASDSTLDARLVARGAPPSPQDWEQRDDDRSNNRPPLIAVHNDGALADAVEEVLRALR